MLFSYNHGVLELTIVFFLGGVQLAKLLPSSPPVESAEDCDEHVSSISCMLKINAAYTSSRRPEGLKALSFMS